MTSPCPGSALAASWPGPLQQRCSWPPASNCQPYWAPQYNPNRRLGPHHCSHLKPIPQRQLARLEAWLASRAPRLCTGCSSDKDEKMAELPFFSLFTMHCRPRLPWPLGCSCQTMIHFVVCDHLWIGVLLISCVGPGHTKGDKPDE